MAETLVAALCTDRSICQPKKASPQSHSAQRISADILAIIDTFPCPLVHGLDLCPSIAYAAALNTTTPKPLGPVSILEPHLRRTLEASLDAFSTSLLSSACGRDLFSPVSTCADCFDQYREWLCRSIIPRCASKDQVIASQRRQHTVQQSGHVRDKIPMTIRRTARTPRTPFSANPTYSFDELLPCMDNCRRVDRKCPVFLGFRCPLRGINANESYAYCGPEREIRGACEGEADGGTDRWGQTWCNGILA
jgi:calcium channel MID1